MIDLKDGDYVKVTIYGEVTDVAIDHFELNGDQWFGQGGLTTVEKLNNE